MVKQIYIFLFIFAKTIAQARILLGISGSGLSGGRKTDNLLVLAERFETAYLAFAEPLWREDERMRLPSLNPSLNQRLFTESNPSQLLLGWH